MACTSSDVHTVEQKFFCLSVSYPNLTECKESRQTWVRQVWTVLSGYRRQVVENRNEDPHRRSLGTGHRTPGTECPGAKGTIVCCLQQMPRRQVEDIVIRLARQRNQKRVGRRSDSTVFLRRFECFIGTGYKRPRFFCKTRCVEVGTNGLRGSDQRGGPGHVR